MGANTDGHSLLSDAQVDGATHFLLRVTIGDPTFNHANTQHFQKKPPQPSVRARVLGVHG
jgi:hypothetical protein